MCTQLTSTMNGAVRHLFCYQCFLALELRVENRNLTIKGGLSQIETILRSPSRQSIARSVGRLLRRSCQFDEGIDTENIRVRPEWRSDWTMFHEHGGNQGIEVCIETRSRRSRAAAKKDSQIKSSEETQYFFSASIAAGSCKFVASRSKVFVPCLGEAGDKLLGGAPRDGHTGMDDVSPCMHPRTLSRVLFKADPLCQDDTQGVVDPSHFMSRLAIGDDVIYHGPDGLQNLNLQAASGFPRPAFAPAHSAINVCKFIPTPPI